VRDLAGTAKLWRDDRFAPGTTPLATGVFYNVRGGQPMCGCPAGSS
jgi:hypothetical protein